MSAFISDLSGSDAANIAQTYFFGNNSAGFTSLSGVVYLAGADIVPPSRGMSLTDADIQSIVTDTVPSPDPNTLYVVVTSDDISQSAFGSAFCGAYCG